MSKTYIRNCRQCDLVFETTQKNVKLCSDACKHERHKEQKRTSWAKAYEANPETQLERNRAYKKAVADEMQDLKPVLDRISFTPDNVEKIAAMIDYIESDRNLVWLLDYYWLSDAKEYLDEYN